MAKASFKATLNASNTVDVVGVPDIAGTANTSVALVDTTAVAAAIAVLVADAASPTAAHVTTLNGAWTTLLALINTAIAAAAAANAQDTGTVTATIDIASVDTIPKLEHVFRNIAFKGGRASGLFTG